MYNSTYERGRWCSWWGLRPKAITVYLRRSFIRVAVLPSLAHIVYRATVASAFLVGVDMPPPFFSPSIVVVVMNSVTSKPPIVSYPKTLSRNVVRSP